MIVLKNVLVASDFDAASNSALIYGRALARTFGGALHLLHVMENQFLRAASGDPRSVVDSHLRWLNEKLTAPDRKELHARAVVETSDAPASAIVEYARGAAIDLIVMGTHGRSGVSQFLEGSVAERVVRTAPCPVLTVRHPEHEFVIPASSDRPGEQILLKHILVPVDFSDVSTIALSYGRELARSFGVQLTVLHVTENTTAGAREEIAALISDEDRNLLKAEAVVRASGSPAPAIVDYTREANIDLIVMGTHGRGRVAHLLIGSVAEQVVRTSPSPVLTVRHPEHEFIVPDAGGAVAQS